MRKIIKLHNSKMEDYKLPMPPNFIRRVSDDFAVPYGELSDAQIKKIGSAWTKQLLEHAAEQRKNLDKYL